MAARAHRGQIERSGGVAPGRCWRSYFRLGGGPAQPALGSGSVPEEEREHAALVYAARGRESTAWGKFKVSALVKGGVPPKSVATSR